MLSNKIKSGFRGALLALFMLLTASAGMAQFKISIQYRPRCEVRRGYATLPTDSAKTAVFFNQRARLTLEYGHERVDVKLSLQDVRVFGDKTQLVNWNTTGIHEAWARIKFGKYFAFRIGRQEWVYDDHRIFGNVDWIQPARAHDGGLLTFAHKGWTADVGGAYNQMGENLFGTAYTLNNYKGLAFARFGKVIKENLDISAIGIMDANVANDTTNTVVYRYTAGATVKYKIKGFQGRTFFYYQLGQDQNYNSLAGMFASLELAYTWKGLNAILGYDYISGNNATKASTKNKAFHTLFATNHKFYGYMDYFLNLPAHTKGGGLQDIYLKLKYGPEGKAWWVAAHYHYFMFAGKVLDPSDATKTLSAGLGSEIDLEANYKVLPWLNITGGASMLFATTSMEGIKGGSRTEMPFWGWAQVNVNPVVFEWAKKENDEPK